MRNKNIEKYIDGLWYESIIPVLKEYIKIPAISPAFEKDWEEKGFLMDTLLLAKNWLEGLGLENAEISLISEKGKTPLMIVEVSATGEDLPYTLLYGHMDKQPEAEGWDDNKGPWIPVVENGKLYGRGGADDAYAFFTSIASIKALQANNVPHGKCILLIETCEESGSYDLDYYLDEYADKIGEPDLVVCLDSGAGDYERMWLTTSLRGFVSGDLSVSLLRDSIHSGYSGKVASSFRVMRQLFDRIEDAETGFVKIPELHVDIPEIRKKQLENTAEILGAEVVSALPLLDGCETVSDDYAELLINSAWRPSLSYTGANGFPPTARAGNALRANTTMKLSFRLPPTADSKLCAEKVKETLLANPPYNAKVSFENGEEAMGFNIPDLGAELDGKLEKACNIIFGNNPAFYGQGGSIPLMNLLADKFPKAKFIIGGVLGPQSNAHGPNESLDIPYVIKLNKVISYVLAGN